METKRNVEFEIKPFKQGAYVGKHLSFGLNGKVLEGNAIAANRTREIRPSGMRGGLAETRVIWLMSKIRVYGESCIKLRPEIVRGGTICRDKKKPSQLIIK
ncbi:unnamed protein product [marine sediment metagenome]|uniref:Uncharacterized protein n=1 Tax=marine sediment metagenome TaxID=412755 RepID=X0V784_9ZZZZ